MIEFFSNLGSDIWGKLVMLFEKVGLNDFFDVLIVAFLIYEIIILVRHTRAAQLAKGIGLLLLFYALISISQMSTLKFFLQTIMQFSIVVIAVVFQPELRRAIEQVGSVNSAFNRLFKSQKMDDTSWVQWSTAIVAVCDAAERMAEDRTGALMVLERRVNLSEIIRTGTRLNCNANVEMIETIFYEGTPLHDGAMVIRNGVIEAAGCFLPLSNNLEISKEMGTRHRSALGMSENSDAVVVVVSEETGIISLAKSGVLIRRLDRQNLYNLLVSEIAPRELEHKPKKRQNKKAKNKNEGQKA